MNRGLVWIEGLYSMHQGDCDGGRVSVQCIIPVFDTHTWDGFLL